MELREYARDMSGRGHESQDAPRKLPWYTVGTGCQPVPGHILHLGIFVNPGSRLAAGTYWALDLQRGAAEKSLTVSVLNELRPSRGKGSPAKPLPWWRAVLG